MRDLTVGTVAHAQPTGRFYGKVLSDFHAVDGQLVRVEVVSGELVGKDVDAEFGKHFPYSTCIHSVLLADDNSGQRLMLAPVGECLGHVEPVGDHEFSQSDVPAGSPVIVVIDPPQDTK